MEKKRDSNKEKDYREGKKIPGYVLILINYIFGAGRNLKKGHDFKKINELFSPYGYEVRLFYNKDKKYILETIEYYARKRDSGSLICFMSSHGDQTSLLCPNGEDVQIIDILKRAKTKELESCPKVFFFDACRTVSDSLPGKCMPEPPTSNYYVGFSCLDTKPCDEGTNSCGVYFEEIINTFKDGFPRPYVEYGKVRDLNHFMNKVHYAVTTKYHQVPTIRTTLVGKVFLQKPEKSEEIPPNTTCFHCARLMEVTAV